jgi:Cof subfamily protein (haloacid dehalogenase superfamily)
MKNNIKLIFFDLDGTLIGSSGKISETDKKSLCALKQLGIKIAFASGRSIEGIEKIQNEIEFTAHSSLFAGSIIFHPIENRIVQSFPLPKDNTKELWDLLHKEGFYVESYTPQGTFILADHRFVAVHAQYMKNAPLVVEDPLFLNQQEQVPIKFVVMVDTESDLQRLRHILKAFPSFHIGTASGSKHPGLYFVNITAVDRATTFQRILELENVSAEQTMSFGDSESDLIFIKNAGIGVAMDGAPLFVKEAADYIAPSVEQNGVTQALHEFIF